MHDVHMSYKLKLIFIKRLTEITRVANAETIHFKDEGGSPHAPFISIIPSLINRDIIDQDIAEGGIDLGPLPRSFFYAPQDQRISFCEFYVTVVPALLSYCHHVRPYLRA